MMRTRTLRRIVLLLPLAVLLTACGAATQTDPADVVSTEFEPPKHWESAVLLSFVDSTYFPDHPYAARVELSMGPGQPRVVTGRDLFMADNGQLRTAWYRVPLAGARDRRVTVRVTLSDTSGTKTSAEYHLVAERNDFYDIQFGVGSRRTDVAPMPLLLGIRLYPVPPSTRRLPTDSLGFGYKVRGRDCFECLS